MIFILISSILTAFSFGLVYTLSPDDATFFAFVFGYLVFSLNSFLLYLSIYLFMKPKNRGGLFVRLGPLVYLPTKVILLAAAMYIGLVKFGLSALPLVGGAACSLFVIAAAVLLKTKFKTKI